MSLFPETIKQSLAGNSVRISYLVLLGFESESIRVWTGFGRVESGGEVWSGLGELGSIEGLEQAINGQAPETSLVLSGVDSAIVIKARDEWETEGRGKNARVYLQFHNDADDQPLELFDEPFVIWTGTMRTARFEIQSDGLRRITVGCESLFALRGRPNFSMYTNSDQNSRFNGDRAFEFVNSLLNKVVKWPDF